MGYLPPIKQPREATLGHKKSDKIFKVVELVDQSTASQHHQYLVRHLSGPLFSRVARLFTGERAVAYILAEPRRRQVWHAVLAAGSRHDVGDDWFERLIKDSAKSLVAEAYGCCPSGFLTLLGRCGDLGHPVGFYRFWHRFLTENVSAIRDIASCSVSVWELYLVLKELPMELRTVRTAIRFGDRDGTARFVDAVRWMHGGSPDAHVWLEVGEGLARGASPRKILDAMLADARCPEPYIVDARFRHLSSVGDLQRAAKQFENCLGKDFLVEEALRGETQFYEWVGDGDPAIVSITSDMPFGWILGSIKGVGNMEPEVDTLVHIMDALGEHQLVSRKSVVDLISGVSRTMARRSASLGESGS